MDIYAVQAEHQDELMKSPEVVGVAIGKQDEADAILVLVETLTPTNNTAEKLGIPPVLGGFPVVVREVGRLTAQPGR
jgi:hypothetical protein